MGKNKTHFIGKYYGRYRCGKKMTENHPSTTNVQEVTCKNCLRCIERDLKTASILMKQIMRRRAMPQKSKKKKGELIVCKGQYPHPCEHKKSDDCHGCDQESIWD